MRSLILAVLLCVCPKPGWSADWLTISLSAHGVTTLADGASSWGRPERNPVLRSADGTFGTRGAAIKAGLFGAAIARSLPARRDARWRRWAIVLNFAAAGLYAGIAVRNQVIARRHHR